MMELIERLYPICRSITGDGLRETLAIIGEIIPLDITEVASGTRVFDWEVPQEWNIRDAWIRGPDGRKVVDFKEHNLHVVSYSEPVRRTLSLQNLEPHLHSDAQRPTVIPYRTSYYDTNWGFCLSQQARDALVDGDYDVLIDSSLSDGSLSYAECVIPGSIDDEVIVFSHTCHPSLCNDNLSGIAVTAWLAKHLAEVGPRHTFRFVYAPGTIGSIAWLAQNRDRLDRIRHGLVAVLLGDSGALTYKLSRSGNAPIDRVARLALRDSGEAHSVIDFAPYGYDERQFNTPGIGIPVGRLTRSANAGYPEYHSSADDLSILSPVSLERSLGVCKAIASMLDADRCYRNLVPCCEPQLGRRGLYAPVGGKEIAPDNFALLWMLNQSDGVTPISAVAERSGVEFSSLAYAAERLVEAGLLEVV